MPRVIEHVRSLYASGAELCLWSTGGSDYARETALAARFPSNWELAGARASGVVRFLAEQKVDPTRAPIQTALGVLGMPSMTAYMGLLEIGNDFGNFGAHSKTSWSANRRPRGLNTSRRRLMSNRHPGHQVSTPSC